LLERFSPLTPQTGNTLSARKRKTILTAGELSAGVQVVLGTIKLDATENAVTAEQAGESYAIH